MTIHTYLSGPSPVAIAHRGGALEAPENTIEAFDVAVEMGYRFLETDAQLTSDGVAVAFHDDRIDRVSSEVGAIVDWTWSDLREVPINGTGRLISISELLERFPDRRFNIDAKSDEVVEPLLDAVQSAGALDRICIGSFSDKRISRMRSLAVGDLCTSLGPKGVVKQVLRSLGLPIPAPHGHAIQVPPTSRGIPVITARLVEAAHRDRLAVHAWTIDSAEEMHRLLDLGVDGIMTDRPSVLKAVFEERGLAL